MRVREPGADVGADVHRKADRPVHGVAEAEIHENRPLDALEDSEDCLAADQVGPGAPDGLRESPAASAACTIGTAVLRHRVSRRVSSSPMVDRVCSMAPTAFLTSRTPSRFPTNQPLEA